VKRLPFFLPMASCPHRCIYCDQISITGKSAAPSPDDVARRLALEKEPLEVCFFGGSFTCLPKERREAYIGAFLKAPQGSRLRFSTHPLCVNRAILSEFAGLSLASIEVGISSLDDAVLSTCRRGYRGQEAVEAIKEILNFSYPVGVQLMIGLPGQSEESSMEDIDRLAYVKGPRDMELRIYPCLVIEGTPLAEMVHSGAYVPLSLEECVRRSGKLLQRARSLGFTILRVGLLETTSLAKSVIGGPYHPALGELARAEALALELTRLSPTGPWVLPSASTSLLLGHGGFGLRRLARMAGMSPDAARSLISWR